jgi:hypothetical protein
MVKLGARRQPGFGVVGRGVASDRKLPLWSFESAGGVVAPAPRSERLGPAVHALARGAQHRWKLITTPRRGAGLPRGLPVVPVSASHVTSEHLRAAHVPHITLGTPCPCFEPSMPITGKARGHWGFVLLGRLKVPMRFRLRPVIVREGPMLRALLASLRRRGSQLRPLGWVRP